MGVEASGGFDEGKFQYAAALVNGDGRGLANVDDKLAFYGRLSVNPTGDYGYWGHDYSGPPALLGASDLVVRVLVGSQPLGEFRVFKGLKARVWRPFKAIRVAADGSTSVQTSTVHFPQARCKSGWWPSVSATAPTLFTKARAWAKSLKV